VFVKLSYSIAHGNLNASKPKMYFLKLLRKVLKNSPEYLRYKSDLEEMLTKGVLPKLEEKGLSYLAQILYD
jgi:hypothetical protein